MKRFLSLLMIVISAFFCFGFTERQEERTLPVLMYHAILKSRSDRYTLSPDVLRRDLAAVKAAGYESVTVKELVAFADGTGTLPARPILVTFDDGHYNNLFYARDILKEANCRAVVNCVGRFTDDTERRDEEDHPNYSYLTWDEIGALARDGTFEIGNHTYDMHRYSPRFGAGRKKGESDEDFRQALLDDIGLQQRKLEKAAGYAPLCFAFPFGNTCKVAINAVADLGFRAVLTCKEGLNVIRRGDRDTLMNLCRYNREPTGIRVGDLVLS